MYVIGYRYTPYPCTPYTLYTPPGDADDGSGNARSAAQRAKQLAAVAAAVYDSSGRGSIRLPLEAEHPLAAVLRHALTKAEVAPPGVLSPKP